MPRRGSLKIASIIPNPQLDEILALIVEGLQITPTQHSDAKQKYGAVGRWLAEGSKLAELSPSIYAQGSLRIGTTVKPHGAQEFDLDLVCELQSLHGHSQTLSPTKVYDLIWDRMNENATYRDLAEKLPRCIRLNYANDFHLDIVPAVPNPGADADATEIPDRALKTWLPSNPKAYARWFEGRAVVTVRTKLAKDAKIEPLTIQESVPEKPPLKQAVQLLKRWRDIAFEGATAAPPTSIVLTTLAAQSYRGEPDVTTTLGTVIEGIVTWSKGEHHQLENPGNPGEYITDRWLQSEGALELFKSKLLELSGAWRARIAGGRYPELSEDLKKLFGEHRVTTAIKKFASLRSEARSTGQLYTSSLAPAMLVQAPGPSTVPVQRHNFFGGNDD